MKWIVWNRKMTACCGRSYVHVLPDDLHRVECPCGAWVLTPLGQRSGLSETVDMKQ